jgi:hypothetical protein
MVYRGGCGLMEKSCSSFTYDVSVGVGPDLEHLREERLR